MNDVEETEILWQLYFQTEPHNNHILMIKKFKDHFSRTLEQDDLNKILQTGMFSLSIKDFLALIANGNQINNDSINYNNYVVYAEEEKQNEFNNNLEIFLKCVPCSLSSLINKPIKIMFKLIEPFFLTSFDWLTSCSISKLVNLQGTVCRIGSKRPLISKLIFECAKCREIISVSINNNLYKQPSKCKGRCRSRTFNLISNTESIQDFQEIRIQQTAYESRIPKTIDVILYDSLVGSVMPGDVIEVLGYVSAITEQKDLYKLIIHAIDIKLVKNITNPQQYFSTLTTPDTNPKELFRNYKENEIVPLLINSLFPDVYGNELIKLAVTFSLFGGTIKYANESTIRKDIHTLIIGPPGLGKSKLLLNASQILPKSNYTCGASATSTGLTVSLVHDQISGDYVAEAGALVLCDEGICCLDEFDKINDTRCLFELMDQQKITVAKAGVVCSIPARTTIVAATNPKYGHFVNGKGNINFEARLMDRFDIVLILNDDLDEEHSKKVSDYILNCKEQEIKRIKEIKILNDVIIDLRTDDFISTLKNDLPLLSLAKVKNYLIYARENVNPILSKAAKEKIKEFFVNSKKTNKITTRDLESIIRICEAKSKMNLKTIVSENDALFCINFYKKILESISTVNTGGKQKKGLNDLFGWLKQKSFVSKNEIEDYIRNSTINKSYDDIIHKLNNQGIIIKSGKDLFKVNRSAISM